MKHDDFHHLIWSHLNYTSNLDEAHAFAWQLEAQIYTSDPIRLELST